MQMTNNIFENQQKIANLPEKDKMRMDLWEIYEQCVDTKMHVNQAEINLLTIRRAIENLHEYLPERKFDKGEKCSVDQLEYVFKYITDIKEILQQLEEGGESGTRTDTFTFLLESEDTSDAMGEGSEVSNMTTRQIERSFHTDEALLKLPNTNN